MGTSFIIAIKKPVANEIWMTKTLKVSSESHPHPIPYSLHSSFPHPQNSRIMVSHCIPRHGPALVLSQPLTSELASSDSGSDPPVTKILAPIHSLTRMLSKVPIILKVASRDCSNHPLT